MARQTDTHGGNQGSATQHAAGLALIGLGAALIALSLSAMVRQGNELQGATIVPPGEFEKKIYLPGDSGRVYFEYNPVRVSEGAVPEAAAGDEALVDPEAEEPADSPGPDKPLISGEAEAQKQVAEPIEVAQATPGTEAEKPAAPEPAPAAQAPAPAPATSASVRARRVSLDNSADHSLQAALKDIVEDLDLDHAVRQNRLGLALVDITDPGQPKAAAVNGNLMIYAASLPKIAILLAAFEKIEAGELAYTRSLRKRLTAMIRHSSNTDATAVLDMVGRAYVNRLLTSSKYKLYDYRRNGGLWVGKAYARGSAYHRDPLHNISHGATANQVARFYYMLETGQLVSPKASREMKRLLSRPKIEHKFVGGLAAQRPGATLYRKSGTWGEYHSDSAIVEHAGRRYIAVALAQSRKGEEWLQELIVAMDDAILARNDGMQLAGVMQ